MNDAIKEKYEILKAKNFPISYFLKDREGCQNIWMWSQDPEFDLLYQEVNSPERPVKVVDNMEELFHEFENGNCFVYSDNSMENILLTKCRNLHLISLETLVLRGICCLACNLYEAQDIAAKVQRKNRVYFYELPLLTDLHCLSREEQLLHKQIQETVNERRIRQDEELYRSLWPKYHSIDEMLEVCPRIPVIRNGAGLQVSGDYRSPKYNVIDGHRVTTDAPESYVGKIYLFGKSQVIGYGAEDKDTIASQLQRMVNQYSKDKYLVVNEGVSGESDTDTIRHINSIDYQPEDIFVYLIAKRRCYRQKCEYKYGNIKKLAEEFDAIPDRPSMFLDTIPHLNYLGNEVVASAIFHDIEQELSIHPQISRQSESVEGTPQKAFLYEEQVKNSLERLSEYKIENASGYRVGSIVMNCNPFTLGHRYLIETAAEQVDYLYIFVVEEDRSIFPFQDRIELVRQGTKDISNVIVLPSGKFMISSLTFPEYFEKESDYDVTIDASMDIDIFGRYVAKEFGITVRFAGEEPLDAVTRQYNGAMQERLPKYGVEFVEIPRKVLGDHVISATMVRKYLKDRNFAEIKKLVPDTTYQYLVKL